MNIEKITKDQVCYAIRGKEKIKVKIVQRGEPCLVVRICDNDKIDDEQFQVETRNLEEFTSDDFEKEVGKACLIEQQIAEDLRKEFKIEPLEDTMFCGVKIDSENRRKVFDELGKQYFSRDNINHPPHYLAGNAFCTSCGAPIECIDISEHFDFCLGNVIKYIWRADHKENKLEDLKKARWYLDRKIMRLEENDIKK